MGIPGASTPLCDHRSLSRHASGRSQVFSSPSPPCEGSGRTVNRGQCSSQCTPGDISKEDENQAALVAGKGLACLDVGQGPSSPSLARTSSSSAAVGPHGSDVVYQVKGCSSPPSHSASTCPMRPCFGPGIGLGPPQRGRPGDNAQWTLPGHDGLRAVAMVGCAVDPRRYSPSPSDRRGAAEISGPPGMQSPQRREHPTPVNSFRPLPYSHASMAFAPPGHLPPKPAASSQMSIPVQARFLRSTIGGS